MIPASEQHDLMTAYHKRLTGSNDEERLACAGAWSRWETATSKLQVDPKYIKKAEDPHWANAFARIESHVTIQPLDGE